MHDSCIVSISGKLCFESTVRLAAIYTSISIFHSLSVSFLIGGIMADGVYSNVDNLYFKYIGNQARG